jgi:hypothetical protein
VSAYSRPNAVTNVVHDHTSVLATIEAKWNLPALTNRDANAATLLDYLDLDSPPAFLTPPTLAAPAASATVKGDCETSPQPVVLETSPASALPEAPLAIAIPAAGLTVVASTVAARRRRRAGISQLDEAVFSDDTLA